MSRSITTCNDDYNNYVYASVDGGNNFRSISEGLPKGQVVMTVAEDPKNPAVLYAGTEFGLFVSTDRGGQLEPHPLRAADGPDPRDRLPSARQRHDSGDARPQHLDSRRCDADSAVG